MGEAVGGRRGEGEQAIPRDCWDVSFSNRVFVMVFQFNRTRKVQLEVVFFHPVSLQVS